MGLKDKLIAIIKNYFIGSKCVFTDTQTNLLKKFLVKVNPIEIGRRRVGKECQY